MGSKPLGAAVLGLTFTLARMGLAQPAPAAFSADTPQTLTAAARITLIGSIAEYDALARAVASLLSVRGIGTLFEVRQQFTEQDFWQPTQSRGLNWVHVWFLLSTPRSARLVFADPELQRFLIRDLPVPRGLDSLGCEAVAQVIESSVVSLLQGGGGLNRTELRSALTNVWVGPPEVPERRVPAEQSRTVSLDAGTQKPWQPRPRLDVAYRLAHTGGSAWLHGPSLMLGIELPAHSNNVLVSTQLDAYFTEHYESQQIRVAIQNTTAWINLGWETKAGFHDTYNLATFGIGLNRAHVEPEAPRTPQTITEPSFNRVRPWLRISETFECGWPSLPLELGFSIDASPYKPRYELTLADGKKQQLAEGSFLRFGVAVGAVFR